MHMCAWRQREKEREANRKSEGSGKYHAHTVNLFKKKATKSILWLKKT